MTPSSAPSKPRNASPHRLLSELLSRYRPRYRPRHPRPLALHPKPLRPSRSAGPIRRPPIRRQRPLRRRKLRPVRSRQALRRHPLPRHLRQRRPTRDPRRLRLLRSRGGRRSRPLRATRERREPSAFPRRPHPSDPTGARRGIRPSARRVARRAHGQGAANRTPRFLPPRHERHRHHSRVAARESRAHRVPGNVVSAVSGDAEVVGGGAGTVWGGCRGRGDRDSVGCGAGAENRGGACVSGS